MKFRTLLLGLSALCIAGAAAFFSVTGLSKLFAGASTAVILMASSLEFAKLISAGFLYNYWDKINKALRTYLLVGVGVLILITSAGIYGFLTSAYQTTADQLGILDKQTEVVQLKKNRFQEQLDGYVNERTQLNQSISELSKGLSNNVVQYTDARGNLITSTSSANRKALESQLNDFKIQRDNVSKKIEVLTDSVGKLDIQIIEVQSGNELAAEVGPLKYMAEITGRPMSTIVNWFALLIIFVFDPLAVSLVIAFNTALKIDKGEDDKKKVVQKRELYGESETHPNQEEKEGFGSASDLSNEPKITENIIETTDNTSEIETEMSAEEEKARLDEMGEPLVRATIQKSIIDKRPYYEHPAFDWSLKKYWINDQSAVKYWMNNVKGKEKSKYPTDFDSKTY
jgi:hypothetical protein